MDLAVALHIIAIIAIMVPSFLLAVIQQCLVSHFFGIIYILSLILVPLGIIAASFGVWFVLLGVSKASKAALTKKEKCC